MFLKALPPEQNRPAPRFHRFADAASRVRTLLCFALCGGALGGCREPLRPDECGVLLDTYVLLITRSDRPETNEAELLKLQAQAREKAARDPSFRLCSDEVSRSEFECAIAASDVDSFERCL